MSAEVFSSDIKNYFYCKRTVYFTKVLRARFKPTAKMEFGRENEEKARIPVGDGELLIRNYYVFDDDLKIGAVIDAVVVGRGYVKIVEVKTARISRRIDENHKMQLTLQAYLVKRKFPDFKVFTYVYYTDIDKFEEIRLDRRHFDGLMNAIREIRTIVENEIIPVGASDGRCTDCQFRTFCADVFS